MAMMLSGMLMLRHLARKKAGDRVEKAVAAVICRRQRCHYDFKPGNTGKR